jgi:hypothetical protein
LFFEVGCRLFFLQIPNENEKDNFYWSFTSSDAFGVAFFFVTNSHHLVIFFFKNITKNKKHRHVYTLCSIE